MDWLHEIVALGTRQVSEALLDLSVSPALTWSQVSEWLSQQWEVRNQVYACRAIPTILQLREPPSLDLGPGDRDEQFLLYPVHILEQQNCERNIVTPLTLSFSICYKAIDNWNTKEESEIQESSVTCPASQRQWELLSSLTFRSLFFPEGPLEALFSYWQTRVRQVYSLAPGIY